MAIFWLFGLFINLWANSWSSLSVFGHFRLNLLNLSVLTIFFGLLGWGSFWALTQIYSCHHKPWNHKLTTIAAWSLKSTRLRGLWSSLVCMPWVCLLCQCVCQHASMPEVCQHARGSSQKCLSFPEVPEGPRYPEGQGIVQLCQMAQNPQDCTYGIIYTWNDICIVLPLMWQPIACGYCQRKFYSLVRLLV